SADRRRKVRAGLGAIQAYETGLARTLLKGLSDRPQFKVWGISDLNRLHERVPTISITATDRSPEEIADHLAAREIYVWNGDMYALELTERLGLEHRGGLLRLGLVHYNTLEEIDRLLR